MILIVSGSRDHGDIENVRYCLDEKAGELPISRVISGDSGNVDLAAEQWAKDRGLRFTAYPADWESHGKAAGPIRNAHMAEAGDMLMAFWDGKSRGTRSMIREARDRGLPVSVVS